MRHYQTTATPAPREKRSVQIKSLLLGMPHIQGHYGAAIRDNVGNIQSMRKAIWAIWEHRNRQHQNCGNWCPSKKPNGGDPNRNALPDYIMEAIRPVFETLSSDDLLEKCAHGGTQNTNESFHHLIWERCPKTVFCGRRRIELAVADATIVFNDGERKRLEIFGQLGIQAGYYTTNCFKDFDSGRLAKARVHNPAANRQHRQQRAVDNAQLARDGEGDYLAGAH